MDYEKEIEALKQQIKSLQKRAQEERMCNVPDVVGTFLKASGTSMYKILSVEDIEPTTFDQLILTCTVVHVFLDERNGNAEIHNQYGMTPIRYPFHEASIKSEEEFKTFMNKAIEAIRSK